MRRVIYLLLILALYSCNKGGDDYFPANVFVQGITFEAIPGGAIMRYELEKGEGVFYVKAEYENDKGKHVIAKGSYLSDSLVLDGFIDSKENVPVFVSYENKLGLSSKKVELEFSVKQSSAKSLYDLVEISSYWNGFKVSYNGLENNDGMLHVGRIGTNLFTKVKDTLLIESINLSAGEQKYFFSDVTEDGSDFCDVVIWTEDRYGNLLPKKIFKDIEAYQKKIVSFGDFSFLGDSQEIPDYNIGVEYLFDGDRNGWKSLKEPQWTDGYFLDNSFIASRNSVPGVWDVVFDEPQELAGIIIYDSQPRDIRPNLNLGYRFAHTLVPCHVEVYGTNNPAADISECDKLGEYYQDRNTPEENRWNRRATRSVVIKPFSTWEETKEAEPISFSVDFDITGKKYKYLKINVLETFTHKYLYQFPEVSNMLLMSELEVYVKK